MRQLLFASFVLLVAGLGCSLAIKTTVDPIATVPSSPESSPEIPTAANPVNYGDIITPTIPLDRCHALSKPDTPVETHAEADESSPVVGWLSKESYTLLSFRSENGWFAVDNPGIQGWLDGGQITLYGDCTAVAIMGDNYDPPPFLAFKWNNPCRFIPDADVPFDNAHPSITEPLRAGQEYVVIGQDETRYTIAISDAAGGWIGKDKGQISGDCSVLD